MFSGNAVVAAQMAFCLVPKILDPIDVIMTFGKALSVINPVMLKFGNIKLIIGFIPIGIDDTIGLHMLPDEADQRLRGAVHWHCGMHLTGTLEQAKGQRLARSTSTPFAFADTAKIALINLDLAAKKWSLQGQMRSNYFTKLPVIKRRSMPVYTNQLGSRPGRCTRHKLHNQSPLNRVSQSTFAANYNHLTNKPYLAYLGQPQKFLRRFFQKAASFLLPGIDRRKAG
jgi:hypothetical protein